MPLYHPHLTRKAIKSRFFHPGNLQQTLLRKDSNACFSANWKSWQQSAMIAFTLQATTILKDVRSAQSFDVKQKNRNQGNTWNKIPLKKNRQICSSLLPSWERSHRPGHRGSLMSRWFSFSPGGICWFPREYISHELIQTHKMLIGRSWPWSTLLKYWNFSQWCHFCVWFSILSLCTSWNHLVLQLSQQNVNVNAVGWQDSCGSTLSWTQPTGILQQDESF